jgi:acyl-CoA synthetase (AMP-forming)/AMP-acid ligase II
MIYLADHLLSTSAVRYPNRGAVSFKGMTLTYAELEAEMNRLAGLLRQVGVRQGDRVA